MLIGIIPTEKVMLPRTFVKGGGLLFFTFSKSEIEIVKTGEVFSTHTHLKRYF